MGWLQDIFSKKDELFPEHGGIDGFREHAQKTATEAVNRANEVAAGVKHGLDNVTNVLKDSIAQAREAGNHEFADSLQHDLNDILAGMKEQATEVTSTVKEQAGEVLNNTTKAASENANKAAGFFTTVGQRFGEVTDTVKTKAGEFADQAKEKLSPMMESAKEKASVAAEGLKERWGDLDPNMQKVVLVGGAVCATVGGLCAGKAVADKIQANHQAANQPITIEEIQQLREQNGAGKFEQMLAAREGRGMVAAHGL